jgi:heat shock protein HspQ
LKAGAGRLGGRLAQAFRLAKVSGPLTFACLPPARPYIEVVMDRPDKFFTGNSTAAPLAPPVAHARFAIGEVVRHRLFDFRGVIFDVDPVFANSEEWYEAIPEDIRPPKDQPFYHLLAENGESSYTAYVSQQNLLVDDSDEPVDHPAISGLFDTVSRGRYQLKREHRH